MFWQSLKKIVDGVQSHFKNKKNKKKMKSVFENAGNCCQPP